MAAKRKRRKTPDPSAEREASLDDALQEIIHLHALVAAIRAECEGCPHRHRKIGFETDLRGGALHSEPCIHEQDREPEELGDLPDDEERR